MQEIGHLAHFKIKILLLSILPLFLIPAQEFPIGKVDSLLKEGIKNIINQDYPSAEKNFSELDNQYPSIPPGKIFLR